MLDKSNSYDYKDKDTDIGDNFYTYKIPDTQRAMTTCVVERQEFDNFSH